MKLTAYKAIVGLAAAAVLSTGVVYANTSQSYKIGDVFDEQVKGLTGTNYVMEQQEIDVTGDDIEDRILVLGQKESKDDIYHSKVNILVKNGKTKKLQIAPIGGGYGSELKVGDFNGDYIQDVSVYLQTGGSGWTISPSIVTFEENNPRYLLKFDQIDNILNLKGKYIDGFKAELDFQSINKKITVDLAAKKENYIKNEVYDISGKLLKDIEPVLGGPASFRSVDLNGDGVLEVKMDMSISGISNSDSISICNITMQYIDGKWAIQNLSASQIVVENQLKSF